MSETVVSNDKQVKVKREMLAFYVKCGENYCLAGHNCDTFDIDTGMERDDAKDVTKSVTGQTVKGYTAKISGTGKYTTNDPVYKLFSDYAYDEKCGGEEITECMIVERYNENRAKTFNMSLGVSKIGGSAGEFVEFDMSGEQVSNSVQGTATIDVEAGTATFTKTGASV